MSEVTVNQGQSAYEQGDYEAALTAFGEAREAARQSGDQRAEASALRDVGVTLQTAGKLDEAGAAYSEAQTLFQAAGDEAGRATVLGNQATLLRRRGKDQEAEALLSQAADLFAEAGNDQYEVDTLRLLAQWQMKRGAWLDSLINYNKAMSRMERLSPAQGCLRAMGKLFLRILGVRQS